MEHAVDEDADLPPNEGDVDMIGHDDEEMLDEGIAYCIFADRQTMKPKIRITSPQVLMMTTTSKWAGVVVKTPTRC